MLHDRPLDEVPPRALYRILQLRSQVFVVEQTCVFLDPDGRDLEPGCRQLWIDDDTDAAEVLAAARVLDEGHARHIGRIVTQERQRRNGLAAQLVDHFLAEYDGPWELNAQARLSRWYERFGFRISGDDYLDDGILHVPMRRER